VSRRLDSWQLHLEEISCYLVEGEGVWWKTCESEGVKFEFIDTENSHEGPKPQHYRTANFSQQKLNAWEKIINLDTTLPTPGIKLYDQDGNFLSTKTFAPYMTMCSTECGLETNTDTTPTAQEESIDMPQHNDDEFHTDSASTDEPVPKDTVSDNLPQSVEHSAVGKQLETENPSEETNIRDTEYPTAPANLKTKLGKALFQSLQPDQTSDTSKEIEEVDKMRQKIKAFQSAKYISNATVEKYKSLIQSLLRKLETKKEEKLQELHTFEICYYSKNNALPEQTEPKYKSMIYENKFVTKLITRETQ
jgi:hypothetical protein